MFRRKLGLLIPALTVGWLAVAAAQAEESAPAAEEAAADVTAEAPAAAEAGAPADAAQPAEATAEAEPAAEEIASPDPAALDPAAADTASAVPDDAATAEAQGGETSDIGSAEAPAESAPALGAVGYDSQGRQGRIHIVSRGDTLWDISTAYLGTPWVWPSIWNDNGEIENPHRIYPGDRIWITPSEMRKISAEEAAAMLANLPPGSELPPAAAEEVFPLAETPAEVAPAATPVEQSRLRVSVLETTGLISQQQLEAAASIVERVPERILLSQEDDVYLGVGEGSVAVGDQLTIFRVNERVYDPDTGKLLGHHIDLLGYVEVTETHPESSIAKIRMSTGEVHKGDRVMPRETLPAEIAIQQSPAEVEGRISFFPQKRVVIGQNDFVYLNRGSADGLEIGSPLEVFRAGRKVNEPARDEKVQVPDHIVARLIVVRTSEESSVALITKAATELHLGDEFRGESATEEN